MDTHNTTAKPRRANLKPPGKCIFCDRGGLTKEHMWADWLRDYIPREMQEHRIGLTIVSPTTRDETIKRRTGDPHSRKIRCICGECNNGWMSQLQEAAKPYLVPMLTGQKVALMMVMVADHVDSETVGIPTADRHWFYRNRRPPSHWRIWIGQHRRQMHPLFTHNVLPFASEEEVKRLPRGTVREANTQTSTICLGQQLIIHVMSSAVARSLIRRWKLPSEVDPAMSQIYPVREKVITWPMPIALTDEGIDLLAQQFFTRAAAFARRSMGII